MEGTCFLKPKAADKEKMKALPPPEEINEPETQTATIVEDSDDDEIEEEEDVEPIVEVVEPIVEEVIEIKPKKKIVRKKV